MKLFGGEAGIRTLGTIASTTVFETVPFDHSGTSPLIVNVITKRSSLYIVNAWLIFRQTHAGEEHNFYKLKSPIVLYQRELNRSFGRKNTINKLFVSSC